MHDHYCVRDVAVALGMEASGWPSDMADKGVFSHRGRFNGAIPPMIAASQAELDALFAVGAAEVTARLSDLQKEMRLSARRQYLCWRFNLQPLELQLAGVSVEWSVAQGTASDGRVRLRWWGCVLRCVCLCC